MSHRFGCWTAGLTVFMLVAGASLLARPDPRPSSFGDREWVKARPDPAARPRIEAAFRTSLATP
jgi:hypothetical protein